MRNMIQDTFLRKFIRIIILSGLTLIGIGPLLFLISGTLMDTQEANACLKPMLVGTDGYVRWHWIPLYVTMKNVVQLLLDSPEFFHMFWNSVKITVSILIGQLVFGTPAAWGLARYRFRGSRLIYLIFIILMMMPFQVMMLSEYLVLDRIHLLNTSAAVILPGMFSTFSVFIMYRFFCGIPDAILEAARVDGAREWQIFLHIGVPLGLPGILSAIVLSFLECWSMMEQPMTFFKDKSLWPLSLYLPQIDGSNSAFALCASFAVVLPAVLVFLCGQDHLEKGIASTAGKG